MSLRDKNISLDISQKTTQVFSFKQYDSGCKLNFIILENGETLELNAHSALVLFRTPDKKTYTKSCEISENKIITSIDNNITNLDGKVEVEIIISSADTTVTTFTLYLNIIKSINRTIELDDVPGLPSIDPADIQPKADNNLRTTNKTIVGAINEIYDNIKNIDGIGDIIQLTTDNKDNLVDAINEIDSNLDAIINDNEIADNKTWSSDKIGNMLNVNYEAVEGSDITVQDTVNGFVTDIEILGNSIQNGTDIQSVGNAYVDGTFSLEIISANGNDSTVGGYQESSSMLHLPCQLEKEGDVVDRLYYNKTKEAWCIEKKVGNPIGTIVLSLENQIVLNSFENTTRIFTTSVIAPIIKCNVPKSLGASVESNTKTIDDLNARVENLEELKESQYLNYEGSGSVACSNVKNGTVDDIEIKGNTSVVNGKLISAGEDVNVIKVATANTHLFKTGGRL